MAGKGTGRLQGRGGVGGTYRELHPLKRSAPALRIQSKQGPYLREVTVV